MQLHKIFRLFQMFSDSDRSEGAEEEKSREQRGVFPWHSGPVCREAGRSIGNERRQLAGSAEVNS